MPAVPRKRRGPATLSGVTRPGLRVAGASPYRTYAQEFKARAAARGEAARLVHALHGDLDEGRVRFGIGSAGSWRELPSQHPVEAARYATSLAFEADAYVS